MSVDPNASGAEQEMAPLKISCTKTDCDDNLHCFKATKRLQEENRGGACRDCGAELVDWDRVHERSVEDVDHTFDQLRLEFIRHHFWHAPIDESAVNHARRKGRTLLHAAARQRLLSSVGRAGNAFDGRQTPFTGNSIYYAQHATASCCRTCIEYWHGIPQDRDLTDQEIDYLCELVVRFLDERMPELPEEPHKVPPRRHR
jgi:hypothetical protein